MKHLITTCDNGLIFFWRLPDKLVTKLQLIKTENKRIEEASERAPTVIEEAPEWDENDSRPASVTASPLVSKALLKSSEERKGEQTASEETKKEEEDFDFEVPEKLQPQERDPTLVKKKKKEVVDVLADIKKATNFIDSLVNSQKDTTPTNNSRNITSSDARMASQGDQGEVYATEAT